MNRRFARSLAIALAIACLTAGIVAAESGRTSAGATTRAVATQGELERLLPPGVQQVLSAFRIFEGLGARNAVYREADAVQRDLRAYYDAQIATAQRQLAEREQLGLQDSQLRAYVRVVEHLRAERAAALAVTEFEKKVAKYGFESAFRRELVSALARVPKVRDALDQMESAVGDLQAKIRTAQDLSRNGNPVAVLVTEVREAADKLERFGSIAAVISGDAGERIAGTAATIRSAVEPVTDVIDSANAAADGVIDQLDSLRDAISQQSGGDRSPRGGLDVPSDDASVLDGILAPTGDDPAVDAIASVIARQAGDRARDAGESTDDDTMRERVRTEVLGRTADRIAEACGRVVGAARRVLLDAAAAGAPMADSSSECTTYDNNDKLDDLRDEVRSELDERVDAAAAEDEGDAAPAATGTEQTDEGDDEIVEPPRIFRGPGLQGNIRWSECSTEVDYDLRLIPDYTATLFISGYTYSGRDEDGPLCGFGEAQTYAGTWTPVETGAIATIAIGSTEFTMDVVITNRDDGPPVAVLEGGYTLPSPVSSAPDQTGTFRFEIVEEVP